MAREYGYEVSFDEKLWENAAFIKEHLKKESSSDFGTLSYYSSQYKNDRYCAQLALQLDKATGGDAKRYIKGLFGLTIFVRQKDAVELALTLPVETEQFYPTPEIERIIRKEWERDEINFVTVEKLIQEKRISAPSRNLFGYEGERAEEFNKMESLRERDYNWEEDPNLSLEDKIAILEDAIDYNRKEVKKRRSLFLSRIDNVSMAT